MVTSEDVKKQYSPATPTSSFPFDIPYLEPSDISVLVTVDAGSDYELVLDAVSTGFSLTPVNGDPEYGATVTTTETYTTGEHITIIRSVDVTQENSFVRGGDIPPEVLNESADKQTMISQQLQEFDTRTLSMPASDPTGLTLEYPKVELRALKIPIFTEDGSVSVIDPIEGGIAGVDTAKGIEKVANVLAAKVDDITTEFSGTGDIVVKTVSATELATDSVISAKIEDKAVTKRKLADLADYSVLGNVSGVLGQPEAVDIIDDDTMATAAATNIASSESIKAYVDAAVDVTSSFTTNGYQILPGGLVIQWGQFTSTGNEAKTIAFPLEFPNACLQITTSLGTEGLHSGDEAEFHIATYTYTKTNFGAEMGGDGTHIVRWIAVGH